MKILDLISKLKEMDSPNSTIKILDCWLKYCDCTHIIMCNENINKSYIYLSFSAIKKSDDILYKKNYYTSELLINDLDLIHKNFGNIEVKVPEPIYKYYLGGYIGEPNEKYKTNLPTGLYEYLSIEHIEFTKNSFIKNTRIEKTWDIDNEKLCDDDILISRK